MIVDLLKRKSIQRVFNQNVTIVDVNSACYYEDHYKVVIENVVDFDKVAIVQKLKTEFWSFPKLVGWGAYKYTVQNGKVIHLPISEELPADLTGPVCTYQAVPSDALHGNFLPAINTTINLLEKHYMDR